MASVSSLDQDMRNLRLSRYTPQAASEVRTWIEDTLGEELPPGDLLDALKDGVALCRLANLALPPPGVKFKKSAMPFIQMENISHFLRACESPPLNMPAHDRFLTVDLYEAKDPAQVIQCIGAFSRVANAADPSRFPTTIGPKRVGASSPSTTGYNPTRNGGAFRNNSSYNSPKPSAALPSARALSPTTTGGSTGSSGLKSPVGSVSSWSKKGDEGVTSPAWNIAQYGYMGGASQGNQGIAFGARRQITTAAPHVPNAAEKERRRREKEAEDERLRIQADEAEEKRRVEREAEEERQRVEEEQRWEEESRRTREQEKKRLEEQKRQWEEQERRWQADEEARLKEEAEMQRKMETKSPRSRATSDARLKGQFLSQYQAEEAASGRGADGSADTPERARVRELEKQLEEARERERQYMMEREERMRQENDRSHPQLANLPDRTPRPPSPKDSEVSWAPDEQPTEAPATRPLPDPSEYQPAPQAPNRTDRFLANNPAPTAAKPRAHQPAEMGFTSSLEEQNDRDRRIASQQKTKAGGWASKSLLEREMERERERQREWEAGQQATVNAARDLKEGTGEGQSWDVNQYGFIGGDNQGRGVARAVGLRLGAGDRSSDPGRLDRWSE
ncbi:calponin [Taxawa tesnikishii (nom. ined.)]|nr:calponin [Dothideales sp. JES 119]